ncbi:hypothetical protein SLEP1_g22917 [Rubroshorea leprosula]|uniref:Uncharacterized protein n=1 Tax=Rubroshorea leprosula TaxID=152421 RepID=A0AAV5JGS8_9ROSI|nr:hypothetical protein SLEP1_g22917 [Rubroshorea leprosula]
MKTPSFSHHRSLLPLKQHRNQHHHFNFHPTKIHIAGMLR